MFKLDSLFVRFLNLVADIFILHILWLVHSLPIVTIGASTTALYYSMMKRIKDEGSIVSNFRSSFKSNFKQSTILWIIVVVVFVILAIDLRFCLLFSQNARNVFLVAYIMVFIPVCFTTLYLFSVQSKFENTLKATIKNAFLMSILNFPYTLVIFLIPAIFLIISIFFPPFFTLLFIMGMGIYVYITSLIFCKIFKKYIPETSEE